MHKTGIQGFWWSQEAPFESQGLDMILARELETIFYAKN